MADLFGRMRALFPGRSASGQVRIFTADAQNPPVLQECSAETIPFILASDYGPWRGGRVASRARFRRPTEREVGEKGQPICDDSVAMDERLREDFYSGRGPST
jgi:hypothetical protein